MSNQTKNINTFASIIDHDTLQYVLASICNFCVSFDYHGVIKFSKVFEDFDYYRNENEYCFGETDAEMPDVFVTIDDVKKIACDYDGHQIRLDLKDGSFCLLDWI